AMGRHALVDLAMVFETAPAQTPADRLSPEEDQNLRRALAASALVHPDRISDNVLRTLRGTYEPFAHTLGEYFLVALPPWTQTTPRRDNWQRTAWDRTSPPFAVSDPFNVE